MATALFIKNPSTISTLDVDQIPELTEVDLSRYSKKYLPAISIPIDSSLINLPEDVVTMLTTLCTLHNGIRLAASNNASKNTFTLHAWVRV